MDQTAGTIVMTITGPFDRWFGAGFGSTMTNADVMLYTTGETGALHPEGPTDYILSATSAAGVTRDAVDDFTIITNTVLATTRTITVQRDLNTSDPEDHALLFSDASLDVTYARASSAGIAERIAFPRAVAWKLSCIVIGTVTRNL